MNDQRKVIFEERKDMMRAHDVSESIEDMREEVVDALAAMCIPEKAYQEQWDLDTLEKEVTRIFGAALPIRAWAQEEGVGPEEAERDAREDERERREEDVGGWD